MKEMAVEYTVTCVPGSLVEMEDEKQLRILQQLFVPLSQAMPALAATGNPEVLAKAAAAMQYIVQKSIELSGSNHAGELSTIMGEGKTQQVDDYQRKIDNLEEGIGGLVGTLTESNTSMAAAVAQLQDQVAMLAQMNTELFEKLGISSASSVPNGTGVPTAEPVLARSGAE